MQDTLIGKEAQIPETQATPTPARRAGDIATEQVVEQPDSNIGSVEGFQRFAAADDSSKRTDFEKDLRNAAAKETPAPQDIDRDKSLDDYADNNSAWKTK